MVIKRHNETFAPVTRGHIRSHGCRQLLVYFTLGMWDGSLTKLEDLTQCSRS